MAGEGNNMAEAEKLVQDLLNPDLREDALAELAKKRETFHALAPLLWNAFGIIAIILQEIMAVYPFLSPPTLTPAQSNRICNVLALLQCVASHPETRMPFLNANIAMYLYPFLKTSSNLKQFEYLRLTSFGVIGAFVKFPEPEVVNFLISSEIMPFLLTTMENGCELLKSVVTFIVHKILVVDVGLNYVCSTPDRFYALARALGNMLTSDSDNPPSRRLLKHIVRCYFRLSDHPNASNALMNCLPIVLRDGTFANYLHDDPVTRMWIEELLRKLQGPGTMVQAGGGSGFIIV